MWGQENWEEGIESDGGWEKAQGESLWRDRYPLGEAALANDLGHTLALDDGKSNELCLSAPSWTGSRVSFTNNL